ncbi:MAG: ClbS/DfsB family four-helix bundle protein [Bacteroidota bacterium]
MPRPTSKTDLLDLSQKNYDKLLALIDAQENPEREFSTDTMNRNIRDVVYHLHVWHSMVHNWHEVGSRGEQPDIPAKGYNWRMIPELNRVIFEEGKQRSYQEAMDALDASHKKSIAIIESHSNEELFTRGLYPWTGNNALGAYFVSCASSHYDWATKLIRKGMK